MGSQRAKHSHSHKALRWAWDAVRPASTRCQSGKKNPAPLLSVLQAVGGICSCGWERQRKFVFHSVVELSIWKDPVTKYAHGICTIASTKSWGCCHINCLLFFLTGNYLAPNRLCDLKKKKKKKEKELKGVRINQCILGKLFPF